jgi:hypothetical protein
MKYLMDGMGITLSFQNFVENLLFVSNYSCLLKLYVLLATIAHSK